MKTYRSTGVVTRALLAELRDGFTLSWHGIHGVQHWGRVRTNALMLAHATGANARVAELFAIFHDSCRLNDGYDPAHGQRGAEKALALHGRYFDASSWELELLVEACIGHSDGGLDADVTVQVCWDADRLDLGRVGITPDPTRLCTPTAQSAKVIDWAYQRSIVAPA